MKHIVMFSSGLGSWGAAKRVAATHGTAGLTLLFADTKEEDPDNYRFLEEAARNVGGTLVRVADGRNVWELFRNVRFLGNTRVPKCSLELKIAVCRRWLETHTRPEDTVLYVGIDVGEWHRLAAIQALWQPYRMEAPLCDPPYLDKHQLSDWCVREGLRRPRLYDLGFAHANCGGACIRAGQAHWRHLLRTLPDVYARWEHEEQALGTYLGKEVAILRDRRNGKTVPLTLRSFRERLEKQADECDLFEWGGCGCFTDPGTIADK